MVKWLCKKYILGKLNGLLEQYADDVNKVGDTLQVWITRLEKILSCLKSTLQKLDDQKIDDDEIDQTIVEVETVIKEW